MNLCPDQGPSRAAAARARRALVRAKFVIIHYPSCCPLVRFSHIGSIEDAARDGPCAHGKSVVYRSQAKLIKRYLAGREASSCARVRYHSDNSFEHQRLTGDARPRFFTLCSRSRCGAREAMTVGCKPTNQRLRRIFNLNVKC